MADVRVTELPDKTITTRFFVSAKVYSITVDGALYSHLLVKVPRSGYLLFFADGTQANVGGISHTTPRKAAEYLLNQLVRGSN